MLQHRFEALLRYVARAGTVEIVADFFIVGRNGFGHRAGGASYYQEPARDFLSGTDFGEGTEGGCIKIHRERFVVSVESFSGRHSQLPFGRLSTRRDESVTSYRKSARKDYLTDGYGRPAASRGFAGANPLPR